MFPIARISEIRIFNFLATPTRSVIIPDSEYKTTPSLVLLSWNQPETDLKPT